MKKVCDGTAPLSCDDKDTAYKIFGGYQFNTSFGAELGYVNLGKATISGVDPIVGPVSANIKAKGFELLAVGTVPLADKFSAYGKLGFFRWDLDAAVAVSGLSGSLSENGTDLTYGIGVKYDIAKNIGARLEWQRYKDIGNEATIGKTDVDVLSIGILFKF
jgi:OOP family OmpA-OmpF porin